LGALTRVSQKQATEQAYSHVLPTMQDSAMLRLAGLFAETARENDATILSHDAEQPCAICAQYEIRLAHVMNNSLVFIHGKPERYTVRDICIHHPTELNTQRYLDATGYLEIGHDLTMVQTTFCTGKLAWKPVAMS